MGGIYLLFSVYLLTACKKDEIPQSDQPAAAEPAFIATTASTLNVQKAAFFDAQLNQRKNLSAYTKTSDPYSAMVVNPACISVVNDPVFGSKRKVMYMNVRPGDTGGVTENPRAQVQTPMQYVEGQEVFAGFSVRFKSTFWTYFLTFSEVYGAPYKGTSPFKLGIQGSNIIASSFDGKVQVNLWKEAMKANVWYDFVYRQVLSKDKASGLVEVWMRKQGQSQFTRIVAPTPMATITAANLTGPNYHKLACYYDRTHTFTDATQKTPVTAVQMYLANHKVGGSFSEVAPLLVK